MKNHAIAASIATLALAACSGAAPTTSPSGPVAKAESTATAATGAAAPAPAEMHGPGEWFFRQVWTLDLRDDQRSSLTSIQNRLATDMAPHREAMRRTALNIADAVEAGRLDATAAAAQKDALGATVAHAKASIATAVNGVHDTLDTTQRVALVARLASHAHDHADRAEGAQPKHGLAKIAATLGLTEQQEAAIRDAMSQGMDELFPSRKARREAWEAKMKAMATAFVTDDFDAADYDLAEHSGEMIASGVAIATRAVDVSRSVLTAGQRRLAAEWMRAKVAERAAPDENQLQR